MDKINPFKEILDSTKRLPDKTLLFPDQHPFIEVWFEEREYKEYRSKIKCEICLQRKIHPDAFHLKSSVSFLVEIIKSLFRQNMKYQFLNQRT